MSDAKKGALKPGAKEAPRDSSANRTARPDDRQGGKRPVGQPERRDLVAPPVKSHTKKGAESHRTQRVEREIREVVGTYLLTGFRGELHGVVSISRVVASKDLRSAKVFFTVMGEQTEQKYNLNELRAHAHEVQHEVNRRLQMKFCPKLSFFHDIGFDNVMRVEKILRDLSLERAVQSPDSDAAGETTHESPAKDDND